MLSRRFDHRCAEEAGTGNHRGAGAETARGLYTGAIGWLGFNGESQFSIAIRTVVAEAGELHFHVGAGIVADSVPEMEWQETLDKAAGILLAAERM